MAEQNFKVKHGISVGDNDIVDASGNVSVPGVLTANDVVTSGNSPFTVTVDTIEGPGTMQFDGGELSGLNQILVSNLTINSGAINTTGSTLGLGFWNTGKGILFHDDGSVEVAGSIIPQVDIAYDLGSPTHRFRDLYLSGSTLYMGGITLSDDNGTFSVVDANSDPITISLAANTTDDLAEGTNLYYTNARVQTQIAAVTPPGGFVGVNQLNSAISTEATARDTAISTAIANLVDTAPTTLDTLNELAAALGDDPNFATTVTNNIATKVTKITSTDNAIALFNGTAGELKNAPITVTQDVNETSVKIMGGNNNDDSWINFYDHTGATWYGDIGTNGSQFYVDTNLTELNFWVKTGFPLQLRPDYPILSYGPDSLTRLVTSSAGITVTGSGTATTDWRAPIFYDSNDTAYYLDLANTSISGIFAGKVGIGTSSPTNNLHIEAAGNTYLKVRNSSTTKSLYLGSENDSRVGIIAQGDAGQATEFYINNGSETKIDTSGNLFASASVRSPIFYDKDDTGYYVNPNSTSNLNSVNIAGTTSITTVGAYVGYNANYNYKPYTSGGVGTRSEIISNANILIKADMDGSGSTEWVRIEAGAGTPNKLEILSKTSGEAQNINSLLYNDYKVWHAGNAMADGSSASRAAPSGMYIAKNFPGFPSGYYWIQSPTMPNPLQMYVDMTEEGGGYDFYPIQGGTSVSLITDIHSGKSLGLELVMPRSKYHWRAMRNYVTNVLGSSDYTYFNNVTGIYRSGSTTGGTYTSYAMRSPVHYGSGAPDWRVLDGGRWWLRDTTYTEPNGDYLINGFLGNLDRGSFTNGTYDLSDLLFNDSTGGYATGTYYLVSTNLKG